MKKFSVHWERNNGKWGWTMIEDCKDMNDAIESFMATREKKDMQITMVREMAPGEQLPKRRSR